MEDVPEPERTSDLLVSLASWNPKHCQGQEYILDAFHRDCVLRFGTLAHSHLLLVLRCWRRRARWNLVNEDGLPLYSTPDGRLDVAAAVAAENLREMAASINDGLMMEVLSWRMLKEEPEAASLISTALNKGSALALRTSEIQAVAVLNGDK